MKTQIYISHEYNAVFEDVGRKIARGDPPLWLLVGLNHFSETFIGGNRRTSAEVKRLRDIIERMDDAAGLLLKWLPAYEHMGLGLRCPDDVRVVLARLPYIKRDLERVQRRPIGRRSDVRRKVCAAVVCEAWRLLHGKVPSRSEELYEACNAYWLACGREEIGETGDLLNWRRHIEKADGAWVRSVLLEVQNSI